MKQGLIIIALVVLVIVGGIAWYMYGAQQAELAAPPVVMEIAPEPQATEPEPGPEQTPLVVGEKLTPAATELDELPLPPLGESDPYVQQQLAGLVGEAATMRYFAAEDLAARVVTTIDALGSRQVPGNIQAVAGPDGSYVAVPDSSPPTVILNEEGDPVPQYLSDPSNHKRYIAYVEMLEAVNAEEFAALYRRNAPLFQQAWAELGYTDVTFEDRLAAIIDELLATPVVEEPYRLIKPEAVYLFADEELESLSAGQKILIRMGSENAARVKSRLSEIRQAL